MLGAEVDVCGSLGCIEVVTRYAGGVVGCALANGCERLVFGALEQCVVDIVFVGSVVW